MSSSATGFRCVHDDMVLTSIDDVPEFGYLGWFRLEPLSGESVGSSDIWVVMTLSGESAGGCSMRFWF